MGFRRKISLRIFAIAICIASVSTSSTSDISGAGGPGVRKLVIGVDGGTESIRACCFDAVDGSIIGKSCAIPYTTYHPNPGWAEQNPEDWWANLGEAVKGAVDSVSSEESNETEIKSRVCAICIDTTCCSVLALDESCNPLRPSLLWMDQRSAPQTKEVMEKCKGDPALMVNCNGEGPLSAEWMTPKAMWIKKNEPKVWEQAKTICEYQDYINYKLTGVMCASSCNAAARWHWDGEECIKSTKRNKYRGRPIFLYKKLGMPELADKLPEKCLGMGSLVGELTKEASDHLGLNEGTLVAQGGPDAFVGMIGLGCIHPQQLCLITGSSHLHCVVTAKPSTAPGSWGAYRGAPLPGINFAEGGQSSTGSIIRWAKKLFGAETLDYKSLDEEAEGISPGSDGLIALETFQGSRTPVTDPLARGALIGLTLSHTRAHIWRALMESVCFGTKACIDGLESAGHKCNEIIIAGGTTRSSLWLQMHADVTGKPVVLCENIDAPLLGCAILASVGAGIHRSVGDAVNHMVREARRVHPDSEVTAKYDEIYNLIYSKVSPAVRPVVHALASIRGGAIADSNGKDKQTTVISPSVLAANWMKMGSEIEKCLDAGLSNLHVDVFDGVYLNSPDALTFGPQMVKAMRGVSDKLFLDIHLCVKEPRRFVQCLARAGANRVIFQFEAIRDVDEAIAFAKDIKVHGMQCGVSINPETTIAEILPLLESGHFDVVDILAVNPGFGGQTFQMSALQKLQDLKKWITSYSPRGCGIKMMVDGGINEKTSPLVRSNGADILVAGTFLFRHKHSLCLGAKELMQ